MGTHRDLREAFLADVDRITRLAVGAFVAFGLGTDEQAKRAKEHPDGRLKFAVEEADGSTTEGDFHATHAETRELLRDRQYLMIEVFHAFLVQRWFRFLRELYGECVRQCLLDPNAFTLRSITLKLRMESLDVANLHDEVVEAATQEWDSASQAVADRAKQIAKLLGGSTTPVTSELDAIKRHVIIRNLHQHNRGIIRARDIAEIGGQPFRSRHGSEFRDRNEKDFAEITPWDLEDFSKALLAVAKCIVPEPAAREVANPGAVLSESEIVKWIRYGLKQLKANNYDLMYKAHEIAHVFHLGAYMDNYFRAVHRSLIGTWRLDMEYNRLGTLSKRMSRLPEIWEEMRTALGVEAIPTRPGQASPDDSELVRPDLILHRRTFATDDDANVLAVEVKRKPTTNSEKRDVLHDLAKLVTYRVQLKYHHAFLVLLDPMDRNGGTVVAVTSQEQALELARTILASS